MLANTNKAIVRRLIEEAWNTGNLAVVDELVAPGYTGHDSSYPELIRGPEGFKEWIITARTAFPDFEITVDDLFAEGDRVVGRITMRGTNRGELIGLPPTGKPVAFSGTFIRRFAGGQLVEGWDSGDALSMMQQLGALRVPAPHVG